MICAILREIIPDGMLIPPAQPFATITSKEPRPASCLSCSYSHQHPVNVHCPQSIGVIYLLTVRLSRNAPLHVSFDGVSTLNMKLFRRGSILLACYLGATWKAPPRTVNSQGFESFQWASGLSLSSTSIYIDLDCNQYSG